MPPISCQSRRRSLARPPVVVLTTKPPFATGSIAIPPGKKTKGGDKSRRSPLPSPVVSTPSILQRLIQFFGDPCLPSPPLPSFIASPPPPLTPSSASWRCRFSAVGDVLLGVPLALISTRGGVISTREKGLKCCNGAMELLAQKWRRGMAYSGLRRCVYVDEVTGGCVSDVVCEWTKMDVLQLMEARWSGETPRSPLVLA